VLEITPGSTNPFLTEQGLWNIFRTIGRDDCQGTFAADYIAARFPGKTAALVHDEWPYGKLIFKAARLELQKKGFAHVIEFGVDGTAFDAAAVAAQIIRSNADVVFWAGQPKSFAQVIKEARAKGYQAIMIGPDSLASPDFEATGGGAIEGVLMALAGDPRRKHEAKAVTQEFTAKGFAPEGYALYAYAAVQVIQQAAETARSIDPRAVAQALHSPRSFDTVLGPLRFDGKGDIEKPDYIWYQYKSDGRRMSYRPYTSN
jgi:branched-chain amino acid transport system substrate-binding protein